MPPSTQYACKNIDSMAGYEIRTLSSRGIYLVGVDHIGNGIYLDGQILGPYPQCGVEEIGNIPSPNFNLLNKARNHQNYHSSKQP